jgi:hypothetical protein
MCLDVTGCVIRCLFLELHLHPHAKRRLGCSPIPTSTLGRGLWRRCLGALWVPVGACRKQKQGVL